MPEPRVAGWDAKVRARCRVSYGSLTTMAQSHGVEVGDIPMRTWSNLVAYFGGTDRIEAHLEDRARLGRVLG